MSNTPKGYIKTSMKTKTKHTSHTHKHGANHTAVLGRLNRIEGQVRGVVRMVEEGRYCIDVLTQLQAVRAAVSKVENEILKDHLGHCIEGAIVAGDVNEQRKKAAELVALLERAR